MSDFLVTATEDMTREALQRDLEAAFVEAQPVWEFISMATSMSEYEDRKALVEDRLAKLDDLRGRVEARFDRKVAARLDDVVAYTYKADQYCPEHIIEEMIRDGSASPAARDMPTEQVLDQIAEANAIDRYDEWTYDSGEFPKIVFRDQIGEYDTCGFGHQITAKRKTATQYMKYQKVITEDGREDGAITNIQHRNGEVLYTVTFEDGSWDVYRGVELAPVEPIDFVGGPSFSFGKKANKPWPNQPRLREAPADVPGWIEDGQGNLTHPYAMGSEVQEILDSNPDLYFVPDPSKAGKQGRPLGKAAYLLTDWNVSTHHTHGSGEFVLHVTKSDDQPNEFGGIGNTVYHPEYHGLTFNSDAQAREFAASVGLITPSNFGKKKASLDFLFRDLGLVDPSIRPSFDVPDDLGDAEVNAMQDQLKDLARGYIDAGVPPEQAVEKAIADWRAKFPNRDRDASRKTATPEWVYNQNAWTFHDDQWEDRWEYDSGPLTFEIRTGEDDDLGNPTFLWSIWNGAPGFGGQESDSGVAGSWEDAAKAIYQQGPVAAGQMSFAKKASDANPKYEIGDRVEFWDGMETGKISFIEWRDGWTADDGEQVPGGYAYRIRFDSGPYKYVPESSIDRKVASKKQAGDDAADVDDVPTPGQEVDDYPQPEEGLEYDAYDSFDTQSSKKASKRYDIAKKVVESKQSGELEGGILLDTFTASALVQVYENLSSENQAKFDEIPLDKLVAFVMSHVSVKES